MKSAAFVASVALFCIGIPQRIDGQITGVLHAARSALNSLTTYHEEPPFTLVREGNGYEERYYPQRKWICTDAAPDDEGRIRYLFYRLFDYITGSNSRNIKMDMTVPVAQRLAWDSDDVLRMCFFIPEAYQGSTPTPTDERVYILEDPARQVAVRRFSGYPSVTEWNTELHELKDALERDGRATGYDFSHYLRAGYDAPWKFYNRRNEVVIFKQA